MTTRDQQRKYCQIARRRWPGAKVFGGGEYAVLSCGAPPRAIVLFDDPNNALALALALDTAGCCPECPITAPGVKGLTHGLAWIREDGPPPLSMMTPEPEGEGGS